MTEHAEFVEALRRYAGMVEAALPQEPRGFTAEVEGPGFLQVERGGALGLAAKGWHPEARGWLEPMVRMGLEGQHADATVIDGRAHYRPLYRAMLVHAAVQTFALGYEAMPRQEFGAWEEGLRAWCEELEPTIAEARVDQPSAELGGAVAEAAWGALALHIAGKVFVRDAWTDLSSDLFGRLTRGQVEDGRYLRAGAGDSIETTTYHELAILHAAAAYAARAEDRHVAGGVKCATEFHLENTQADHATNQPFGVFAFIWNERTRSVADGMLHAAQTVHRGDGVRGILLGDALVSLRLFIG